MATGRRISAPQFHTRQRSREEGPGEVASAIPRSDHLRSVETTAGIDFRNRIV